MVGKGGSNGHLFVLFSLPIATSVNSTRGALFKPSQGSGDEYRLCLCRPNQARLVKFVPLNTCFCVLVCSEIVLLVELPVNWIFSAGCKLSTTCPSALEAL